MTDKIGEKAEGFLTHCARRMKPAQVKGQDPSPASVCVIRDSMQRASPEMEDRLSAKLKRKHKRGPRKGLSSVLALHSAD